MWNDDPDATGVTLAIDGPGAFADYGPSGSVTRPRTATATRTPTR
jgi:hypothetical protein